MLIVALVAILVSGAQAQNADPERIFNQALAAQKAGDLETAVSGYERVLKLQPGLVAARANLAAAQVQLGRVDEAIASYKAALRQDPRNVQLTVLLGDTYISQKRYADAISLLQPAEKVHPENLDVAFLLGEALIDANKLPEGLKRVEHVASVRKDANAWTLAALTEIRLAQYSKASASAEAAIRTDPSAPAIYTISGMAKAGAGNTEAAQAAYRKAIAMNADDFDANLRLGALLLRDGQDVEGAKRYLEHAFQLNPESLSAVFEMGQLAVAEKHDAEAIGYFEQVVQRAPNLLEPHVRLSVLYARGHRDSDAAREKETVNRIMTQQQKQDPNALPDDLLGRPFSATPPSH